MMNKIMNEALRKLAENYIGSGVGSKQKLLVSNEDAAEGARSANLLAQTDDDGLVGRAVSRISHQEIQNQKMVLRRYLIYLRKIQMIIF